MTSQTTTIKVSKDHKFYKATCTCGWESKVYKSKKLAAYYKQDHEAKHASHRSKSQIAADRKALLESISTDWQLVPFDAHASDVKSLIASGSVEVKVLKDLPARDWLQKGRLLRKVRYVRKVAQ